MSESIRNKRKNHSFSEPEILDIANSIIGMIDKEGLYTFIDPDHIMLGPDNKVSVDIRSGQIDEVFIAPEASGIISEVEGLTKEEASAASAFFSLGMLMYYMDKGSDWYTANNETLLGRPEYKEERDSLISDTIILGGLLCDLTSWDPEVRISVGRINLLRAIERTYAALRIQYVCSGVIIKEEEIELNNTGLKGFGEGIEVYDDKGNMYKPVGNIDIPYRPGIHDVTVKVESSGIPTGEKRKKLIVITEGTEVGYSKYDLGYVLENELSEMVPVTVEGEVIYNFYVVEVDNQGNSLDEKKIAGYRVRANTALTDCRLFVKVDESGSAKTVVYYRHNGQKPQPLTNPFKFTI